jgi:hypothetical protein
MATAVKRSEPRSWAAERELIELAKTMYLEAIVKKTGRKPDHQDGQAAGSFDQGTEGEEGCRKVSLNTSAPITIPRLMPDETGNPAPNPRAANSVNADATVSRYRGNIPLPYQPAGSNWTVLQHSLYSVDGTEILTPFAAKQRSVFAHRGWRRSF